MSTAIPNVLKQITEQNGKVYRPCDVRLEELFDISVIYQAIYEAQRGKMWKSSVTNNVFYRDYLAHEIHQSILSGTYQLDPLFHTIINERGKERLISSLTFRDRVVEKVLNQGFILPLFVPKLIYTNCASLQDRGIHFALNHLEQMMYKMYLKYGKNYYVAKCDIKSYFDSIPHEYMYNIFDRYTMDKRIMWLVGSILEQFRMDSDIHNGDNVPYGIGLGGEVSQSFGTLCLNELDHIMTEDPKLKAECYIRYMDDFIFMGKDLDKLKEKMQFIYYYLKNLNLKMSKNKCSISHINEGIKFLKVHFFISNSGQIYKHPCQKSFKREIVKLYKMHNLFINNDPITLQNIEQSYYSWRGYINSVSDIPNIISIYDDLYNNLFNYENVITDRITNK